MLQGIWIMRLPFYKRILSYFLPVRVARKSSSINPVLDIFFYKNQWQLATSDALYSDGARYRPLRAAFTNLKDSLRHVRNVLILGAGLGSAVHIIHRRNFFPQYTVVEIDQTVLQTNIELMPDPLLQYIHPVCADAKEWINECTEKYELLVTDIFIGRNVPEFVTTRVFLEQCKQLIKPGGHFVFNYIAANNEDYFQLQHILQKVFPATRQIEMGVNKIFIAAV